MSNELESIASEWARGMFFFSENEARAFIDDWLNTNDLNIWFDYAIREENFEQLSEFFVKNCSYTP